MNGMKNRGSPSGLGESGSLPAKLFVEEEIVNLTPQESRCSGIGEFNSDSNGLAGHSNPSPQVSSTANSGQTENSLILSALPSGGMKSPCTSANSVYQNRETAQEREDWLDAIAKDDRRDRRIK